MFVDDGLGAFAATPATSSGAEGFGQLLEVVHAAVRRFADFGVGDGPADTDVHSDFAVGPNTLILNDNNSRYQVRMLPKREWFAMRERE